MENTALSFLEKRRSIRKFLPDQISEEQLHALERSITLSASAKNEQAWFFVVIQRPDVIQQLGELSGRDNPFYDAPTLFVAFAKEDAIAGTVDTALAMSSVMYTAVAVGLGTCFINCAKDLFNNPEHKELKESCGVPEGYTCIGSLAIGIPDQQPNQPQGRRYDVFSYIR